MLSAGQVLSVYGDAQLAKEAEIVLGEGLLGAVAGGDFDGRVLFGGEVVEGDGGFKHEHHIEAVTTDVLHDTGDVLALGDRLIDGLAELLNEFTQTCCHRHLQGRRPTRGMRGQRHGINLPYFRCRPGASGHVRKQARKRREHLRCYHHSGMKAENIGRALGIGLRVAGRMAGQKLMGEAQTAGAQQAGAGQAGQVAAGATAREQAASAADSRVKGQAAGRTAKGLARGVGGFLKPFRRVGGILWLEMTGAFFFLFVVAVAPAAWRYKPSHLNGPYDKSFLAAVGIMVVFFYLGASSFWRARRR